MHYLRIPPHRCPFDDLLPLSAQLFHEYSQQNAGINPARTDSCWVHMASLAWLHGYYRCGKYSTSSPAAVGFRDADRQVGITLSMSGVAGLKQSNAASSRQSPIRSYLGDNRLSSRGSEQHGQGVKKPLPSESWSQSGRGWGEGQSRRTLGRSPGN